MQGRGTIAGLDHGIGTCCQQGWDDCGVVSIDRNVQHRTCVGCHKVHICSGLDELLGKVNLSFAADNHQERARVITVHEIGIEPFLLQG